MGGSAGVGEWGFAPPRGDVAEAVVGVAVLADDRSAGLGGGDAGQGAVEGIAMVGKGGVESGIGSGVGDGGELAAESVIGSGEIKVCLRTEICGL